MRASRHGAPLPKTLVHPKFDVDVVEWSKRHGRGHQVWMNAVLRRDTEVHRQAP